MTIHDSELGTITLRPNPRARKIICRYRDGRFLLTHPPYTSKKEIEHVIESMRQSMLKLRERTTGTQTELKNGSVLNLCSTKITISEGRLSNFYCTPKDGAYHLICPEKTDYNSPSTKAILKKHIENILRKEAHKLLPPKVEKYASLYHFSYQEVKINKSRSRWGSCSSKKNINLSYFCLFLPEYLINFVILHELCHTKEMNHGPEFWKLLDSVTKNKSQELTKELSLQSRTTARLRCLD